MKPLSPRERKLVAVGLLATTLALVWLAAMQPVLAGFAARGERREALLAQYAQNERLIGRIAALRRAAEEQARQRATYAVEAGNADQAAEHLKERLAASLVKAGGELRASENVEARPGWVRASVTALVSNNQLLDWLGLVTSQRPFLALESLTMSADQAHNSNHLDLMDVKLEASVPFAPTNAR